MNIKTLQQFKDAEAYFESVNNISKENFFTGTADPTYFFKRAKLFLKLLGQPDLSYKIIHIAGTSGKGTTVNTVASILQEAGYDVGVHVSPFVSVATEKIQVNGTFISAEEFIDLVEEMKPVIEQVYKRMSPPSFFECWMMAALRYFQKKNVDYVVLETGCGGRFDASNAVKKTEYSLITNIGIDHTFLLGKTISKIAFEKAGIIRHHGKVITTAKRPTALKVIKKVSKEKQAKLTVIKDETDGNIALATAVSEKIGINKVTIQRGIKNIKLPARFEIMQQEPTIIIDGAHNHDKITYFVNQLKERFPDYKEKTIHVVVALTDKKDPENVFAALKPLASHVYATRFLNGFRTASDPQTIAKTFGQKKSHVFLDPKRALAVAKEKAKPNDIIIITGSFFLCADLRAQWIDPLKQLEHRKSFP